MVDDGGIGMAVAEDDFILGEGGEDGLGDVFGTVGEEEEEFGLGADGGAFKEETADGLAEIAVAGFAGEDDLATCGFELFGEVSDDGGLSGAFGSFEGDEHGLRLLGYTGGR